ncbi:hypothetical protein L3Q82_011979 [Scortum barcoo]|uniref:Uncharacterized protein n=1 Tax=Scortum barcoo TaxID=214431 RepID=A0ACB8W6U4_9TELE|nr:hypothetical protein L3Q82_011979 [Scortum barcoo]
MRGEHDGEEGGRKCSVPNLNATKYIQSDTSVSVFTVEPPTDVNLRCHNLHNVLTWSYDRPSPGLRFQVDYCSDQSCHVPIWVDPPNLKAVLPVFSDPSYDYFVSVTAVVGENNSDATPPDGIRFSYFKNSQEEKKCFVDFPSVNVTAQPDGFVLFRFIHPWLLYNHRLPASLKSKSRQKRNHDAQFEEHEELPTFTYDVIVHQEQHHDYICEESVCEEKLPVDDTQDKHCLKMKGELEKISVRGTREFCALKLDIPLHGQKSNIYIYVISVVVFTAFALILFMVYKKTTKASSPLPHSVNITSMVKQLPFRAVQEQVIVAEVGPPSPTPLLPSTEDLPSTVSPSTDYDVRLPLGLPAEDEGVCVEEVRNEEGPGYMGGGDFDDDDTLYDSKPSCGYEKREKVLVDLAPDEQTEGYRG